MSLVAQVENSCQSKRMPDPIPAFFRSIRLIATSNSVHARVADNVHDFAVTVHHDGSVVTEVVGRAYRFPWTTCPAAVDRLNSLAGCAIDTRPPVNQSLQCTHMLDLARLAIAHIQRGGERDYRILIETVGLDRASARIARDGRLLFEWRIENDVVTSPQPFAGHIITGRSSWSSDVVKNTEFVEAGLVLRRSLLVFKGRPRATPVQRASSLQELSGVCHSFQPQQIAVATRPPGFAELESPAGVQLLEHTWPTPT
jgi:Protein of unknown function (DUF2889)